MPTHTARDEVNTKANFPILDAAAQQEIEQRYLIALDALVEDTQLHDSGAILVDVLAWTMARLVISNGSPWGAGFVMRKIGEHVCNLHEGTMAQQEAERARKNGELPN